MVGVRLNHEETNDCGFTGSDWGPRHPAPRPRPKPPTNSLLPFSEVGALQSLGFLELYPLTAGNKKEWESRLLAGNVCIYLGPVRVTEREKRKNILGPLVETVEVSSSQIYLETKVEATLWSLG